MSNPRSSSRGHLGVDLLAGVLLLGTLALPWDLAHRGIDHWYVLVAVLVSLASMALPWLPPVLLGGRGRSIRSGTLRYVLVLPMLACVAVTVLVDLLHVGAMRGLGISELSSATVNLLSGGRYPHLQAPQWAGVGSGVAMGLAGALVAGLPRPGEGREADLPRIRSLGVAVGILGLVLVLGTTLLAQLAPAGTWSPGFNATGQVDGWWRAAGLVLALLTLVAWLPGLLLTRRGSRSGPVLLACLGGLYLLLALVYVGAPRAGLDSRYRVGFDRVESLPWGGYGEYLLVAAAVLACAPLLAGGRAGLAERGERGARRLPRDCLLLAGVLLVGQVLLQSLYFTGPHLIGAFGSVAHVLAVGTLGLVSAVVALVAAAVLGLERGAPRVVVPLAAGVLIGLGIVSLLLVNLRSGEYSVRWVVLAGWFVLPLVASWTVLVAPLRARLGIMAGRAGPE